VRAFVAGVKYFRQRHFHASDFIVVAYFPA